MKSKNLTQKIIALFTVLCFTLTFAGQNLSWAAQDNAAINDFKKVFDNAPQIPAEYGKITAVNDFGGKSVVVNIQDLHCHPQAQKHISRIIEILDKNYNVKNIFVEGAYGKIDTSWLTRIDNKEIRDSVIEEMLAQGRLTASEYYAVKNDKSHLLLGLEHEKEHKENIARLGTILENQEKYKAVLKEVKKDIDYLDAKYTNSRNKKFNRLIEKYKTGKINSEKFYAVIGKYVHNIDANPEEYSNVLPINMFHYPNIEKYTILMKQNSKLNTKQVYSQMQTVLSFLREKLPYNAYKAFLEETENLSNMDTLAIALAGFCNMYGINLEKHRELNAFLKMQALGRSLNPVEMLYEEKDLIEKLRIALSYDQAESEIAFLNDFYQVFGDYLENKLLPEDLEYFVKRFDKFRELFAKYAVTDTLKKIENDFPVLNAYYKLNEHRNTIFVENILKNSKHAYNKENLNSYRSDKECLKESEDVIIVVSGGFHSKGLQEILEDKRITNITITPTITAETKKADNLYEKIIKEQSIFLREALAFTIASQAATAEQFTAMVNAGIKFLESAGYSQITIDSLFKELTNAIGSDAVKTPVFGEKETLIEFTNGNSITIQNNNGKLSVKESFDETAVKPEIKLTNKEILSFTGDFITSAISFLKGDLDIVYGLIKNFFQFAYDKDFNNFSFSEGITNEIDSELNAFAKGDFSLDGVNKAVLARMPERLQNLILVRAIQNNSILVYEDGEPVRLGGNFKAFNNTASSEISGTSAKKLTDDVEAFQDSFREANKEYKVLLQDYIVAVEQGKKTGHQKGTLIDLRKTGKEIILVGDLHAREDNLEEILRSNNNEQKIKDGKAVIVFLGDIIHSEEEDKLDEIGSSLSTMERIMRLKVSSPENVYLLLGNHDLIDTDAGKGMVNQGKIYRENIEFMGPEYAELYRKAIFGSGLLAVGDSFAATHAGPVRKADLDKNPDMYSFLTKAADIEKYNEDQEEKGIIFQLIWNRWNKLADAYKNRQSQINFDVLNESNNEYRQKDVDAFLAALKVKNGSLIVGHTPSRLEGDEWYASIGDNNNHHIIFAARDNAGYLSIPANGTKKDFKFVNSKEKPSKQSSRFRTEELKDFLSRLSDTGQEGKALENSIVALIYDFTHSQKKFYTNFELSPLDYGDLTPQELEAFENSSPAAVMHFASTVKEINPRIEKAAEILINELWSEGAAVSGNEVFEAIKARIKNDEKTTISFACSSNFNRSAVAEIVFRDMLQRNGNKNITILSAGTLYDDKQETFTVLPEEHEKVLMSEYGIDKKLINSFRSEQFSDKHANADFVIAADVKHKEYVLERFPHLAGKVFLFNEIVPDIQDSTIILDVQHIPSKGFENEDNLAERMHNFASHFFDTPLIKSDSNYTVNNEFENALAGHLNGNIVRLNLSDLFRDSVTDAAKKEIIEKSTDFIKRSFYSGDIISVIIDENDTTAREYTFEELTKKLTSVRYLINDISNDTLSDFFGRDYLSSATFSFYEMLKNAISHGNNAFLDKPLYIKFDTDNKELKVITIEQKPDDSRKEAASYDYGGLSGMGLGTGIIAGAGSYELKTQVSVAGSDFKINEAYLTFKFPLKPLLNLSPALKNIIKLLSGSEELNRKNPADILLICGNDNVETFKKALELYKNDSAKKILISGGFGRLTIPVLKKAAELGIPVKISNRLTISSLKDFEEKIAVLDENEQKELFSRNNLSEAKIISIILLHLAKQDGILIVPTDLILDDTARHTGENFTNETLQNLADSLGKSKTEPVRLAYIQTPLQQLRTKATFNDAFRDQIKNNEIKGISITVDPYYETFESNDQLINLSAGELLRIIIYSLNNNSQIDGSIAIFNEIPLTVWYDIAVLMEESDNVIAIKNNLKQLVANYKNNDGEIIFPSKESIIDALQSKASKQQFERIKVFVEAIYEDSALELPGTKYVRKADERGYKGFKRALYISVHEAFQALLPNFVKRHYPGNIIKDSAYYSRVKGNIAIKTAAIAGLALGFAIPVSLPLAAAIGVVLSFTFNIFTHSIYNVLADKKAPASQSYYYPYSINDMLTNKNARLENSEPFSFRNFIKSNTFKIIAVILVLLTFAGIFTYQQIHLKNLERESIRLQEEIDNFYIPPDAKFFDNLFTRTMLSTYHDMPEDETAFQKAKQDSIAASLDEENVALIKETYKRLRDAGIIFERNYTVFLIAGTDSKNASTLPSLEVMFISAKIIDFENFTRDEIIAELAERLAHELDHIERRAENPLMSTFELEYYGWEAGAKAREVILGAEDETGAESRIFSEAFGMLVENYDYILDYIKERREETKIEYFSEKPDLNYLYTALDKDEGLIQIILYDRDTREMKYVVSCVIDMNKKEFYDLSIYLYSDLLDAMNSILPQNLETVNKMAQDGKGAAKISIAVAFKEFIKSVFHPVKFINMHPTSAGKTGAAILVAVTYAFAIAGAITALFIPVIAIAFIPAGLLAGAFSNIITHVIIDYHYIKSSGLIEAVKEFGSAVTLTQEGYVNLPVYVINERPENYKELGLKNTGVSLEGNTLWAGKSKSAVVVYADGVNQQAIVQELASNRKINNIIKENASNGAKKALNNISVAFIEVDHSSADKSVSYSESGNIKVSADLVKEAAQRGNLTDLSASLRKTQNVDGYTLAQGIIHHLDDIETLEDFKEYLLQHQKAGNGQIMINESLYNQIKGSNFSRFLAEARKDGVQVFIMSADTDTQELALAGFAGYVSHVSGELYNFALGSKSKIDIGNFNDLASLEETMKNSGGTFVINNSLLKNALNSERSPIGINQIVEILSSVKILKIFHSKPLTGEFVLNAARNFEMKDIPALNAANIEALKNLINKDFSVADFKMALGIKENAVDPVSVYLMKIKTQTSDNAAITQEFMSGIIEKALAADVLRKAYKEYGLKDRNQEIILGRALFDKVKHNIADVQPDITPDSFKTVKEADEKLNETLAGLMPKAFENRDAKAINAIIELIPAVAQERKMAAITDNVKPTMNIRSYRNILSAA